MTTSEKSARAQTPAAPTPASEAPAPEIVRVALDQRSYDIHIGDGVLAGAGALIVPHLHGRKAAIVTDANVAELHLDLLETTLDEAGIGHETIILPPGEPTKSFKALDGLCDRLLKAGIERGDLVIAFGGGVIGDLAGFAAAILRRGVGLVQIPTTLLAQVDSSVGGKTGINTQRGKNLIGSFHQPALVIADAALLDSLDDRQFAAGYAEVAKYGLIVDEAFFAWLEENREALFARDRAALAHAVATSCRIKAEIVARDEREGGVRALLNLGHTFGHALEAATGYGDRLLHGEAVAIGMVLALELSERLGLCPDGTRARAEAHLAAAGLPTQVSRIAGPALDTAGLLAHMAQDKKAVHGELTFILARRLGEAFITRDVPGEAVAALIDDALAGNASH